MTSKRDTSTGGKTELRFLDALGQGVSKHLDADAVLAVSTEMLALHLSASVCAYADMDEDEDGFTIRGDWAAPGSSSIIGHYSLAAFGTRAVEDLHAGRPLVINDNQKELPPEEAAAFQSLGITATVCMPLIVEGRLRALMAVHQKTARVWTPEEIAIIREVTERSWAHVERARAEAELREGERRYRTLFNGIDQGFCVIEFCDGPLGPLSDYIYVETNPAFYGQSGVADVVGRRVREVLGAEAEEWVRLYRGVLETGKPIRHERELEENGRWLELAAFRIEPAERKQVAVLFQDLSARRAAEMALRDSEERYRTLFNAIDEGFCIIEFFDGPHGPLSDYIHIEANDAYTKHAGIPDVVGKKLREMVGAEADDWVRLYRGVLETGTPIRFERELEATGRWLELSAYRVEPASRNQVAILFQDQTDRKLAELALRESEEDFRTLARAMPNQAWTALPNGMLDWFNEQVYVFSGMTQGALDGAGWAVMVHDDDIVQSEQRWTASLKSGETYENQFRLRRADGVFRWHLARAVPIKDDNGKVTRWVGTNTDIQDQKEAAATLEQRVEERTRQLMQTEEALRQSQKMEAVGQLTGGLAHDFNNLLAGISGSLELIAKRLAEGRTTGLERYLSGAQESTRRAASLTQRLLAFSRRQTLDPRPLNINKLVAGLEDLVRRSVGPDAEVEVVQAGGLWTAKVDESQLENALLNLCINARDAMAPNGGRITIETANKWLDDRAARERDLPAGQYVSLCVTDTGTGMSDEVISRAFDPFFTTKPLGQGTGLGLSMVYGFVRQSGGQVRIYSEVGAGTTMCLYFPRHHGEADELIESTPSDAVEHGHGEVVLVVDDEVVLRMLMLDVLQEAGYRALEANDGPTALKVLESDQRIDLLITDVGLPGGMNGRQIADAARRTRPDLKVLFITGYAENAVVGNGHLAPGMEILTKPFEIAVFGHKVRDMIDRG